MHFSWNQFRWNSICGKTVAVQKIRKALHDIDAVFNRCGFLVRFRRYPFEHKFFTQGIFAVSPHKKGIEALQICFNAVVFESESLFFCNECRQQRSKITFENCCFRW